MVETRVRIHSHAPWFASRSTSRETESFVSSSRRNSVRPFPVATGCNTSCIFEPHRKRVWILVNSTSRFVIRRDKSEIFDRCGLEEKPGATFSGRSLKDAQVANELSNRSIHSTGLRENTLLHTKEGTTRGGGRYLSTWLSFFSSFECNPRGSSNGHVYPYVIGKRRAFRNARGNSPTEKQQRFEFDYETKTSCFDFTLILWSFDE